MARIMVECSNPNDMKELEAAMEQAAGKCNVTYFEQHKAMVGAGKSTGQRDSARKIAADTGESPAAVESRIRRGKAALRHDDAPIDAEFRVVSTRVKDPLDHEKKPIIKSRIDFQTVDVPDKTAQEKSRKGSQESKRHTVLNGEVYDGFRYADMAIAQLERIEENDPKKIKALTKVQVHIARELSKYVGEKHFCCRCPKCGKDFKTEWEHKFILEAVGHVTMENQKKQ